MAKQTEIKELGEFGLIDFLTKNLKIKNESTVKGVGDDCAVIEKGEKQTVVSTDMLVHKVHFDLMYSPAKHLGYKSIIVGISDIYAMNVNAEQVLVSIAVDNTISVELLEELYNGMITACENYKVDLVGGDTTTIPQGLIINITAIGSAKKEKIIYRKGAKKNEVICVTGDLGASYIGLLILEREKEVFIENSEIKPKLEGHDYILKRNLKPEARKDIVKMFDDLKIKPTSMIDISDGLSSELLHICKNSKVGCKIFEDKIPIDEATYNTARELNLDPTMAALNGGEDYELLFTVTLEDFEKIKNNSDITAIGHITDEDYGAKLITKSNNAHSIKAQGWESFKG